MRPVDITFDSSQTTDYDNPRFIVSPPIENCLKYSVVECNIPFSFYIIDNTNNSFRMYSFETVANTTAVEYYADCKITPGTYTANQLGWEMRRAVNVTPSFRLSNNAARASSAAIPYAIGFQFQVDESNGRLLVWNAEHKTNYTASSVNQDVNFGIKVDSEALAKILGVYAGFKYRSIQSQLWLEGAIVASINDSHEGEWATQGSKTPNANNVILFLRGDNVVNMLYSPSIMVMSDLDNGRYNRYSEGKKSDNLLIDVPIQTNFLNYIFYQPTSADIPYESQSITKVEFWLQHGDKQQYSHHAREWDGVNTDFNSAAPAQRVENYLSLNGQPWQITIRFWVDDGVEPEGMPSDLATNTRKRARF